MSIEAMADALMDAMFSSKPTDTSPFVNIWTPRRPHDFPIQPWPSTTSSYDLDHHHHHQYRLNLYDQRVGTNLNVDGLDIVEDYEEEEDAGDFRIALPGLPYIDGFLSSPAHMSPSTATDHKSCSTSPNLFFKPSNPTIRKTDHQDPKTPSPTKCHSHTIALLGLDDTKLNHSSTWTSIQVPMSPIYLHCGLSIEHGSLPVGILSSLVDVSDGAYSSMTDDDKYFLAALVTDDSYSTITASYDDGSQTTIDESFFIRPDSDIEVDDDKGDDSTLKDDHDLAQLMCSVITTNNDDKENVQTCRDCGMLKTCGRVSGATSTRYQTSFPTGALNDGICKDCEWKPATKTRRQRRPQNVKQSRNRRPLATLDGQRHNRYKSTLCMNWLKHKGQCPYGVACHFAHGQEEVRPHQSLKTPMKGISAFILNSV